MIEIKDFNVYGLPIVKDFTFFLNYIQTNEPQLEKPHFIISSDVCCELNQHLCHKETTADENSGLLTYRCLYFMFIMGFESGLVTKKQLEVNGSYHLVVTPLVKLFETLNEQEKYFYILEHYWHVFPFDEVLDEFFEMYGMIEKLVRIKKDSLGKELVELDGMDLFLRGDYLVYFQHFILLGLVQVLPFEYIDEDECEINTNIFATLFGKNIINILLEYGLTVLPSSQIVNVLHELELPYEPVRKDLFELFKQQFPSSSVTRKLKRFERAVPPYNYQVKVKWGRKIRRIVIGSHHTLGQLHQVIQSAYELDDDHMFEFKVNGALIQGNPMGGEAFNIPLNKLGLSPDDLFIYLYDFGAEIYMWVQIEDYEIVRKKIQIPYCVKKFNNLGESSKYIAEDF